MKIESLEITRRPSYDSTYPNMLVGTVRLVGTTGDQTIKLSNAALSKIFKVITDEVVTTSADNARMSRGAMSDAMHEPLLAGAASVGALE